MLDFLQLKNRGPKNIKSILYSLTPIFYVGLLFLSLLLAFGTAKYGLLVGLGFIGICIGGFLVIKSIVNLQFGIYMVIIVSFFIMGTYRFYEFGDFPIALVVEIFVLAVVLSVFFDLKKNKSFKINTGTIGVLLIIWVAYHILQLGNPNAASRVAWFYAVRHTFVIIVFYFILCYAIRTEQFVGNLLKLWIGLVLLAAIYCLKQEYFGLFSFETKWLYASESRFNLLVNWGKIRKFSFMEGPMVLGIILAYTGVLCFTLLTGPFSKRNKVLLAAAGVIMFWAMIYTGTRTATILLPIGMVFYALLTLKKEVLVGVGIFMILGTGLVLMPTGNSAIFIMKTAFRGSEDASMNVRLTNQELIQPYLHSHPIGGGVGSTGAWGAQFSPHTFIGSFPPDSEYLRVAIELGWIGLFYFCAMIFFILKIGLDNYLKTKNLRIKTFYIGILTVTFMTTVAMYPQEAIRVHPTGVFFALCAALLTKMVTLQKQ